jgi:hypothetical protein
MTNAGTETIDEEATMATCTYTSSGTHTKQ